MKQPRWRGLYIAGAVAALIAVAYFRRNCGAEMTAFRGFGIWNVPVTQPSTAAGWFNLLHEQRYVGLVLFELHDIINYAILGLVFLALHVAWRETRPAAATAAVASGLLGVGTYLASNQALAMLSLSNRYAAATTEAQRSALLAAGKALLAHHNPGTIAQGTGIWASLFLVLVAGLLFSITMLRDDRFGRAAAVTRIVANGLALTQFPALAFVPALYAVAIPTVVSAPFRVIWLVLIALRLLRLVRRESSGSV